MTSLEMKVALPARPATESSPGRAASISCATSYGMPVRRDTLRLQLPCDSRQLAVASRRRPSVKTRPNSRRSQMTMNCAAMNMEL